MDPATTNSELKASVASLRKDVRKMRKEMNAMKTDVNLLREDIKQLMDVVSKSHSKMDQHVDFVEGVYSSVRHPLNYVKNRIEHFMGKHQSPSLPQIEDHHYPDDDSNNKT